MNELAKNSQVSYLNLSILATSKEKGIPAGENQFISSPENRVNILLHEKVPQLKKMNIANDEYNEKLHYICQQFRISIEKGIEDYLLSGVVKRFSKNISSKRIRYLRSISKEDCVYIDGLMTRYSYYDHSSPDETPLKEISVEDLETDLSGFISWIQTKKQQQRDIDNHK